MATKWFQNFLRVTALLFAVAFTFSAPFGCTTSIIVPFCNHAQCIQLAGRDYNEMSCLIGCTNAPNSPSTVGICTAPFVEACHCTVGKSCMDSACLPSSQGGVCSDTSTRALAPCTTNSDCPGGVCNNCRTDVQSAAIYPACLPPELNLDTASPDQQNQINSMSDAEYAGKLVARCDQLAAELPTILAQAANRCPSDFQCKRFAVAAALPGAMLDIVGPHKIDTCRAPCADVMCTPDLCHAVVDPDKIVNLDSCDCTVAAACGQQTDTICVVPPGGFDPATNPFGLLTRSIAGQSSINLDSQNSALTMKLQSGSKSDTQTGGVNGIVRLFGGPRTDGTADIIMELDLATDPFTFHFTGAPDLHINNLVITGGTGTTSLHLNANGDATLPGGSLTADLDLTVASGNDTVRGLVKHVSLTTAAVPFHIDFAGRTFSIPAIDFTQSRDDLSLTGHVVIVGAIGSQPPTADAGVAQTVECTSPNGAVAQLDGTGSSDPDGDIELYSWSEGPAFGAGQSVGIGPVVSAQAPLGTTNYTLAVQDSSLQTSVAGTEVTVVDTTPPSVTCAVAQPALRIRNHRLVNVGLSSTAADICAGPRPVTVSVYSDEDDVGTAGNQFSPDAADIAPGTLRLRAEREGNSDGRVYLIVPQSTDPAGNTGFNCCTVVEPHSRNAVSMAAVEGQATAARSFCLKNNGTPPPGYFMIGDGPVIGKKQ